MLKFNNVHFSYDKNPILTGVNFEIEQGDFNFLIGKSGSGKSTLLKLIYLSLKPEKGDISFAGFNTSLLKNQELPELRKKLGIIFQDLRLLKDRNIFENLSFILEVTGNSSKNIKEKINKVLSEVGLMHRRYSMPNSLSGGELQRVAIARAIINDPILILADEPTGNLDPETTDEIMTILKNINLRGTTLLFATHNYDIVKRNKYNIFKLQDGKTYKAVFKPKQQL